MATHKKFSPNLATHNMGSHVLIMRTMITYSHVFTDGKKYIVIKLIRSIFIVFFALLDSKEKFPL